MFANLTSDKSIVEDKDVIGGSGPMDSCLFTGKITVAYGIKSKKGAAGVVVTINNGTRDLKQTIYVSSGDAKGNKNTYQKGGETHYLPGYNLVTGLCLLTVGKELKDLATDDKLVGIYDYQSKKEIMTTVPMLIELLGQEITVGVQRVIENKNVANDKGVYVPSGETRELNEIDKFFRTKDGLTVAEIKGGLQQAAEDSYMHKWEKRWAGVIKDKSSKAAKSTTAFGKATAAASATPDESIFKAKEESESVAADQPAPNMFSA
jgi:hypothetical protein